MKKINIKSKQTSSGVLREHHLKRLVVRPLAQQIKQQQNDCVVQGKKLLDKLIEVTESIEIIAREVSRHAKRGK